MPQYVLVKRLRSGMSQELLYMGYARQPCIEDVQPQMGMPNMTMYRDTVMTNKTN